MRHFPLPGISFAEIRHFKGLENEAVMVLDVPEPGSGPGSAAEAYVAMSRPRGLLSLIYGRR
jgi:hypothetical protein